MEQKEREQGHHPMGQWKGEDASVFRMRLLGMLSTSPGCSEKEEGEGRGGAGGSEDWWRRESDKVILR